MIEVFFTVVGELALKHAFQQILHSRASSSDLANAIVNDSGFGDIDKERLLKDERYFNTVLNNVKSLHSRFAGSVDTILKDQANTQVIQTYLKGHPLLRGPIERLSRVKRHNFLILGHQRAGKTSLIQRMLYSLVKDSELGLSFSQSEPAAIFDKAKRYESYDHSLRELALSNEMLDQGRSLSATAAESNFYLDMEHYRSGQLIRLQFFDYAGGKLDEITEFHSLLDNNPVDGILVVIDSHRLIAEELRISLYEKGLLKRDDHQKARPDVLGKDLFQLSAVTDGIRLRLQSVKRDGVPICFALTKFDGFDQYGMPEVDARTHIYQKLSSTLLTMANMKKHPLAICLTSAFGKSFLARDEQGVLVLEDLFTGLPALRPSGSLPFAYFDIAGLPLKFLLQTQMQINLKEVEAMLQQCRSELDWFDRLRYSHLFDNLLRRLQEEHHKWASDGLLNRHFAVIPQGEARPENILDSLFLSANTQQGVL